MSGYFAVSFAFGILAVDSGCTVLEATLISLTNLTSAGQFAGLTVIAQAGSLLETAVTQLVINARYMLMSIALSQKVDEDVHGIWRWILGYGVTDEIFAAAIQSEGPVRKGYFGGLMLLPVAGWTAGTFLGAFLGNILPEILTNALGVALYGMFIAVFVPKSVEDRHVCITVLLAVAISVLLNFVPAFAGSPADLRSSSAQSSPRQWGRCSSLWKKRSEKSVCEGGSADGFYGISAVSDRDGRSHLSDPGHPTCSGEEKNKEPDAEFIFILYSLYCPGGDDISGHLAGHRDARFRCGGTDRGRMAGISPPESYHRGGGSLRGSADCGTYHKYLVNISIKRGRTDSEHHGETRYDF